MQTLLDAEIASPLGPLHVAASTAGLVRLVFDDHPDAAVLLDRPRRTGGSAARSHVAGAPAYIEADFSGSPSLVVPCDRVTRGREIPDA